MTLGLDARSANARRSCVTILGSTFSDIIYIMMFACILLIAMPSKGPLAVEMPTCIIEEEALTDELSVLQNLAQPHARANLEHKSSIQLHAMRHDHTEEKENKMNEWDTF